MDPMEYLQTEEWKKRSEEVVLEIVAVFLPIFIYFSALLIGEFGFEPARSHLDHIMEVPDALFGACILLSFATIRGWSAKRHNRQIRSMNTAVRMKKLTIVSLVLLIVCSCVSGLAVISTGKWALIVGFCFMYVAVYLYKMVTFCAEYCGSSGDGK